MAETGLKISTMRSDIHEVEKRLEFRKVY